MPALCEPNQAPSSYLHKSVQAQPIRQTPYPASTTADVLCLPELLGARAVTFNRLFKECRIVFSLCEARFSVNARLVLQGCWL